MTCRCVPSVYVTIYGTPAISEMREVRHFFNSRGIPFEEFDISTNPQSLQKLKELSGQTARPVIIINDRVFTGFDQSELESAVPSLY